MASITEVKKYISGLTEKELATLYVEAKAEAEDRQKTAAQRRQEVAEDMKRIKAK